MNKIKRTQKGSTHQFLVEEVRAGVADEYPNIWFPNEMFPHELVQSEIDGITLANLTNNIEIRIKLNGHVQLFFMNYSQYPQWREYEILDWFVDNILEWSNSARWIDRGSLGTSNVMTRNPTAVERLAGVFQFCDLMLDINFRDDWNFTVASELKGGNEYDFVPLHVYVRETSIS